MIWLNQQDAKLSVMMEVSSSYVNLLNYLFYYCC